MLVRSGHCISTQTTMRKYNVCQVENDWKQIESILFIKVSSTCTASSLQLTAVASVCAWMYFFSVLLPEHHVWKPHRNSTIICHINLYQSHQHSSQQPNSWRLIYQGIILTLYFQSSYIYLVHFVEIFWFHTGHNQIAVQIISSLFWLDQQNAPPHDQRNFRTNEAQCPRGCQGQACRR